MKEGVTGRNSEWTAGVTDGLCCQVTSESLGTGLGINVKQEKGPGICSGALRVLLHTSTFLAAAVFCTNYPEMRTTTFVLHFPLSYSCTYVQKKMKKNSSPVFPSVHCRHSVSRNKFPPELRNISPLAKWGQTFALSVLSLLF